MKLLFNITLYHHTPKQYIIKTIQQYKPYITTPKARNTKHLKLERLRLIRYKTKTKS